MAAINYWIFVCTGSIVFDKVQEDNVHHAKMSYEL
jgi:hypothetical protein